MVMMNLEATTIKTTSIIVVPLHPTKSHVISSTTNKVIVVAIPITETNKPQILIREIGKILVVVEVNNTINIASSPEQKMNTSLCLLENILLAMMTNLESLHLQLSPRNPKYYLTLLELEAAHPIPKSHKDPPLTEVITKEVLTEDMIEVPREVVTEVQTEVLREAATEVLREAATEAIMIEALKEAATEVAKEVSEYRIVVACEVAIKIISRMMKL